MIALLISGKRKHFSAALDSKGTNFWVMFPAIYQEVIIIRHSLLQVISTQAVRLQFPDLPFSVPFTVTAGTVTTVTFPMIVDVQTNDAVTNMGIHITC